MLRNKVNRIPIIPVFLADLELDGDIKQHKFVPFSKNKTFPDVPHARNQKAKSLLENLRC